MDNITNDHVSMMKILNKGGLQVSAELLGSFFLKDETSMLLYQYGKSLLKMNQTRRALKHFNKSLDKLKQENGLKEEEKRKFEYKVKQKCVYCLVTLSKEKSALNMIKNIPDKYLTLESALLNARLVRHHEGKRCTHIYVVGKPFLITTMLSIEAVVALIDAGVGGVEIRKLCKHTWGEHANFKWIYSLFEANQFFVRNNFSKCVSILQGILEQFPENPHVLKQIALALYCDKRSVEARTYFHMIQKCDKVFVESMDVYAYLLREVGNIVSLNILAHEMLEANPNRSETWATVSLYYDAKGKYDIAMEYAERAIYLNPRNPMAFMIKGELASKKGQYDVSISALRNARTLQRDYRVYKNLVQTYLQKNDHQTALVFAKQAQQLLPGNPSAIVLTGLVFSSTSNESHQQAAEKLFNSVLEKHPECMEGVLWLSGLYVRQTKYSEAIQVLEKSEINDEKIYLARGDIFVAQEMYNEAIVEFDKALELNPLSVEALQRINATNNLLTQGENGFDSKEDEDEEEYSEE